MAKVFTHDCKKCKTETEHDVVMQTYSLRVTCKTCGANENVPYSNQTVDATIGNDSKEPPKRNGSS